MSVSYPIPSTHVMCEDIIDKVKFKYHDPNNSLHNRAWVDLASCSMVPFSNL